MIIPYFTKRNARYRGPRESEKHVSMHRERLVDFSILFEKMSTMEDTIEDVTSDYLLNGDNIQTIVVNHPPHELPTTYYIMASESMHDALDDIEKKIESVKRTVRGED